MATPRRNGQLSSCEPCRKSKLRCDHSSPTCQRCIARRQPELCIYHPAPMSKGPSQKVTKLKKKRGVSVIPPIADTPSGSASGSDIFDWMHLAPSSCTHSSIPQLAANRATNIHTNANPPSFQPGFLGPTSHSVTWEADLSTPGLTSKDSSPVDSGSPGFNPRQIEVGAQILSLLNHIPFFTEVIEKRFLAYRGWVYPPQIIRLALEQLHAAWRENGDSHCRRLEWSRAIFHGTASTIETRFEMTLAEYVAGICQRWETVGLIFSFVGAATYQIAQEDPILHLQKGMPGEDRHGLRKILAAASDMCLQFCQSLGTITDPLLWLTIQHTIFLIEIHGYSDYRVWRSLGDVTSLVFALGLHQRQLDASIPFFLAETRKRSMIGAYGMDKEISTFFGRPPRISWRYYDIQSPLDLSWEQLAATPSEIEAAVQRLDSNGWNVDGDPERGSIPHLIHVIYVVREKILELSLSHEIKGLEEKVEEIRQEANETYLNLPSFLQLTPDLAPWPTSLRLEFLYHDFLLLQCLVKRTGASPDTLVSNSREILNLLLERISKETRLGKVERLSIYDLYSIGLPVAGVLSTELLRHSQLSLPGTTFPRSEVIQKLSVFATYLETFLQHREGHVSKCLQGLAYIRQVLDRVLSSRAEGNASGSLYGGGGNVEDMDLMALLENFDWEQEMRLCFS